MCGIAGYIGKKELNENLVSKCFDLMKKRGPDNFGKFTSKKIPFRNIFLHSRLSIIDLNKKSNQPFSYKNRSIVFNGEIYNYLEIRKDLEILGHKFSTNSDTEVLLHAYIEYGEECVGKFNGMWSFLIIDEERGKIFASRDRFGEKPFYYYFDGKEFVFGSEVKFINLLLESKSSLNVRKIQSFINFGYRSLFRDNETYYNKIIALEPGKNLIIDFNLKLKIKPYWKSDFRPNYKLDYNQIKEELSYLLEKSLSFRLRSDVPLAFCLSGGIDSGFLTSFAAKKLNKEVHTFSIIDSNPNYNEETNIDKVVKDIKCKNTKINITEKTNFFDRLRELNLQHDSPLSTISFLAQSFLSEEISNAGFRVSLSGTGADEIFTGYYNHYLLYFNSIKGLDKEVSEVKYWEKFVNPIVRNSKLKIKDLYIKNPSDTSFSDQIDESLQKFVIKNDKIKNIKQKFYCDDILRNMMLNELFNEAVPVTLFHDDLNSMNYSVENRSPYLDHELLKFMLTVPTKLLINNGYQKFLLRDVSENFLHDDVRLSRQKYGFNISIKSVLNDNQIKDFLLSSKDFLSEIINLDLLIKDLENKDFKIDGEMNKFLFSIISSRIFLSNNSF